MTETERAVDEPAGAETLREERLAFLSELDRLMLDVTSTLPRTLQFIVNQTQHLLGAQYVDILFEYADGLRFEASSDTSELKRVVPVEHSLSGLALVGQGPILANDIAADPVLRDRYFPRTAIDLRDSEARLSVLVATVELDGRPIGVINVEATEGRPFERHHLDFLTAVAHQVSRVIAHAALFDEDKFRTETDALLLASAHADSERVMRDVLTKILQALKSVGFLDTDVAEILVADPRFPDLLVVAYSTNEHDIGLRVGLHDSVCGEAFRTRSTVLLNRAWEHPQFRPVQEGMRCELAIPISLGGSQRFSIGVLNIESAQVNAFSKVSTLLAERFARRVSNAVAMIKIRADLDTALQDQMLVRAADQVLNAVHRINNHVGSARAIASDLLADLETDDEVPEDLRPRLRRIVDDTTMALEIPEELRKRIGAPEASADVNDRVRAGFEAQRLPRTVRAELSLAPDLPELPCTALDLVVENLVMNAVQAMRETGGTLRVTTEVEVRPNGEEFVVVAVHDTGTGMDQGQVDRLFEPREDAHRGRGLGFGMVWVRGWVRRAEGFITVDSEVGAGTSVYLRFQVNPGRLESANTGGEPS